MAKPPEYPDYHGNDPENDNDNGGNESAGDADLFSAFLTELSADFAEETETRKRIQELSELEPTALSPGDVHYLNRYVENNYDRLVRLLKAALIERGLGTDEMSITVKSFEEFSISLGDYCRIYSQPDGIDTDNLDLTNQLIAKEVHHRISISMNRGYFMHLCSYMNLPGRSSLVRQQNYQNHVDQISNQLQQQSQDIEWAETQITLTGYTLTEHLESFKSQVTQRFIGNFEFTFEDMIADTLEGMDITKDPKYESVRLATHLLLQSKYQHLTFHALRETFTTELETVLAGSNVTLRNLASAYNEGINLKNDPEWSDKSIQECLRRIEQKTASGEYTTRYTEFYFGYALDVFIEDLKTRLEYEQLSIKDFLWDLYQETQAELYRPLSYIIKEPIRPSLAKYSLVLKMINHNQIALDHLSRAISEFVANQNDPRFDNNVDDTDEDSPYGDIKWK